MSDDKQAAAATIESLREGFQADGADLELLGLEAGVARVRLVVTADTCMECIVPTPMLHGILDASLRQAVPNLLRVDLEDPRPPDLAHA